MFYEMKLSNWVASVRSQVALPLRIELWNGQRFDFSRLSTRDAADTARILPSMREFLHNKEKDAEAIRYHYDVSNDFYRHVLDKNMVYSCAYNMSFKMAIWGISDIS